MCSLTLEQAIAEANVISALEKNATDIRYSADSDAGDDIAFALQEYIEALKLNVLSDELLTYDIEQHEPHVIRLSEITFEEIDRISEGELILLKGINEYERYMSDFCYNEDIYGGDVPTCFDLDGNLCRPFDITDGRDPSLYPDEDKPCNYKRHIDINTDSHNSFMVRRYLRNSVSGYIYILALAFAATSLELKEDIDADFVKSHVTDTLIDVMKLIEEEYNEFYADMVEKAVADTEHMLYALRYKNIGAEGMALSNIPYGDSVYTVFANIFGCSVFNPYVRDDNITYDIFSII